MYNITTNKHMLSYKKKKNFPQITPELINYNIHDSRLTICCNFDGTYHDYITYAKVNFIYIINDYISHEFEINKTYLTCSNSYIGLKFLFFKITIVVDQLGGFTPAHIQI